MVLKQASSKLTIRQQISHLRRYRNQLKTFYFTYTELIMFPTAQKIINFGETKNYKKKIKIVLWQTDMEQKPQQQTTVVIKEEISDTNCSVKENAIIQRAAKPTSKGMYRIFLHSIQNNNGYI